MKTFRQLEKSKRYIKITEAKQSDKEEKDSCWEKKERGIMKMTAGEDN